MIRAQVSRGIYFNPNSVNNQGQITSCDPDYVKVNQQKSAYHLKSDNQQQQYSSLSRKSANKSRQYLNSCPNNPNISKTDWDDQPEMTMRQVTMRQVISKELPLFSGSPSEWPMFISTYTRTTQLCGLTDDENLERLKKCLRGDARDVVKAYLYFPHNVPQILKTLKMLFGQSDVVLDLMITQIESGPPIHPESLEALVKFSMQIQHLCATAIACQNEEHLNNLTLMRKVVHKLPAQLKLQWAEFKAKLPSVNLHTFGDWLGSKAEMASTVVTMSSAQMQRFDRTEKMQENQNKQKYVNTIQVESNVTKDGQFKFEKAVDEDETCKIVKAADNNQTCVLKCESVHLLAECPKFKKMKGTERWKTILANGLCRKCFRRHRFWTCKLDVKCEIDGCKGSHHQLLHNAVVNKNCNSSNKVTAESTGVVEIHQQPQISKLRFRIVPVVLHGLESSVKTYAFLDEGSSVTQLDEEVANKLKLDGLQKGLELKWTGSTTRREKRSRLVELEISGVSNNDVYKISDVYTVPSLDLPEQTMKIDNNTTKFSHLRSIPFVWYENARPRILIGLQHLHLAVPLQIREGRIGEPIAAKTRLGWAIFGKLNQTQTGSSDEHSVLHISSQFDEKCIQPSILEKRLHNADDDLHDKVKEFFSLENFGVKVPEKLIESKEDERAREIMERTTQKVGNHYETGLLWRSDSVTFPNSYPMAARRLACLERKLEKEPTLNETIKKRLKDYEKKGFVRKLSKNEAMVVDERTWYLPIFTVTNPNKPGKIRLVWDAAAEVNGTSLNSVLLKGPDLLVPLPHIIMRFRQRPVALTGDIKEMFHQIKILEKDQRSQRFLWRDGRKEQQPDAYVMRVMTFGASCSPSSAQFVKNLNAMRFQEEIPEASAAICHNHYVDDWLDSFSSEEEAIRVAKEVIRIHLLGGFEIRNFVSNSRRVTRELRESEQLQGKSLNISGESDDAKVLGMWWSVADDTFYYRVNLSRVDGEIMNGTRKPTKREVLRTLMMVFDPLGLIAHILVYVKILLQDIWRTAIKWDDPITDEQEVRWKRWTNVLPELRKLKIPRCYIRTGFKSLELHVFVDASEAAYAAAAYFRVEYEDGVQCVLVGAKTKVAPQKPMSIPRLELQAALLGARLASFICCAHTLKPIKKWFWSDSMDVLWWLRSDHKRYRQFVAYRVGEILESTDVSQWRWVPTKSYVADNATKWKSEPRVSPTNRWFVGPEFLYGSKAEWPIQRLPNESSKVDEELRQHFPHNTVEPSVLILDVERFSKWSRLVRTMAWALRAINNMKADRRKISGELTCDETQKAESELLRDVQRKVYPDEISCLKVDPAKPLDKASPLFRLTPFSDENSILRVRGRISKAKGIAFETKNPIILPNKHRVTHLILAEYHERLHHHNHETAVNEVRQKYYISKLRVALKRVRTNCQKCKIERAKPNVPEMAGHPPARLASYSAPFSFVGIDYFGPMEVTQGRRAEKRWGVLFTCLTTRAIHLEIAHTLDKSSCLMAIWNFIARRGTPLEIRTDNGTNFHGVNNELNQLRGSLQPDELRSKFDKIRWKFNPPASPHMGGCWERLIQSVKKYLTTAMPTRKPNDEVLRCYLMEAENIINSRPLTYIPIEPERMRLSPPTTFFWDHRAV